MQLSELETAILNDIIAFHADSHPDISQQLEKLKVKDRDFTGFGIYVNFDLDGQLDLSKQMIRKSMCLGSNSEFYLDTLEFQISYELNLNERGQFEFLEIVPNGVDSWDGTYNSFKKK